ncbi:SGNH/GDSL hydrolase family protein [Algoriphagus antarcticus]|uniref:Lysophospholipase L1-like esterase n=1 Tax=Algoriphagus antarcticus TaxID=238540 RepID=A0A3E0E9F2_9BACT|nr:SGNH/GDSL hydrolase family protein [Algoriphagus antarcticus]REG94373.1 lysophospholipase L1-like esterase [Algoriphagus antarcticus]
MKSFHLILISIILFVFQSNEGKSDYLNELKLELQQKWPGNRTINLVFHGHSVPAGYFKTPVVNTLESYPYLVLQELKAQYPFAVINVINTSIGGEDSKSGAQRFESGVLIHKPDVLFIDYALNDRRNGIDSAKVAWESMIKIALEADIKIILLTPSPDQKVNLKEDDTILDQHSNQIRGLSEKYEIGLVDSYALFKKEIYSGIDLPTLMSQGNHPNEKGHALITQGILEYFK